MAAKQLKSVTDKASSATEGHSNELTDALRNLTQTVTGRATNALAKRVTSVSGRLSDYAGGGGGLVEAVTGGKPSVKGKAAAGAVKGGLSALAQKVKDVFTGGRGGGRGDKIKVTNIVEEIDIGAPVDLVYEQWTRFTDFPRFMKKVENVEQVSDEKLEWKAQIFWSHRTWEATILEQVPNECIIWRSEGQKGHVDGAVTFHELTPDLTKVVLVLAYHPQGLFERTGNIWRAQGRRARLELKHFRRHVMTELLLHPDEVEGWRGEIHDGKVADHDEETGDQSEEDEAEFGDDEDQPGEDLPEDEEEPAGRDSAERAAAEEDQEHQPDDEEEEEEAEPERTSRRGRARSSAGSERRSRR